MGTGFFKILYFIAVIVWVLPVLRHWNRKFFYYFLVLGISDPISLLFRIVIGYPLPQVFYSLSAFLLLVALLRIDKKKFLYILVLLGSLILISSSTLYNNRYIDTIIVAVFHGLIFFVILKLFALNNVETYSFNFFYILLIFYELTTILKLLLITIGTTDAIAYFLTTTVFQILFGLYFAIFREDDQRLIFKL